MAAKQAAKMAKKGTPMDPVTLQGRKIATSWWGAHWNENLERYADFAYRLERGRSYVRNGMVLDLKIAAGQITALVAGSRPKPYNIKVTINPLAADAWKALVSKASGQIESISKLLDGEFPADLKEVFFSQHGGLFPSPKEIKFGCSCPDWASMCKHVAATLYGVGARLDRQPAMFFELRGVKLDDLVGKVADEAAKALLKKAAAPKPTAAKSRRILGAGAIPTDIGAVFGIAMEQTPSPTLTPSEEKPVTVKPAKKKPAKRAAGRKKPGAKSPLARKTRRARRA
jgi:uncharacterized Zn finger protein